MAMYRFPAHRRVDIDEYAATDNQKDTASNNIIDVPPRNFFPAYLIHRAIVPRIERS